jgi:hypothetical protein
MLMQKIKNNIDQEICDVNKKYHQHSTMSSDNK